MTTLSPLLTLLAARYRLADGLWRFTRTAWLGPLAAFALLAWARLWPLADDRLWALVLGFGVALVLALLAWRRRIDPLAAAVRTDRALGLRDRLATAWLLAGGSDGEDLDAARRADRVGPDPTDWVEPMSPVTSRRDGSGDGPPSFDDDRQHALRQQLVARQRADALAAAAGVDPRTVAPLRWSRRPLLVCALLTVGAIALALLPNPQHAVLARRAAVKTTAVLLAANVRRTEAGLAGNDALTAEDRRQAGAALRKLTEALERSKGRADTDLAAVADAETALRRGLNQDALRQAAAARGLAERLAALSREARRAAPVAPPAASDGQSSADLKRLAATVAAMDQAARDRLAQALQDESRAAGLDQPEAAKQLADLAEAVRQGDPTAAGDSARSLGDSLDAAQASAAGARSMQDALAALQAGRSALAQANASGQPADPAAIADGAWVADAGAAAEGAPGGSMGQGPQGRPGAGDGSAEGTGPQGEGAGQQGQGIEPGQDAGQAEAGSGQGTEPGQGKSAGQGGSGLGQGADSGTTSAGSAPAQSGDGSGGGSGSEGGNGSGAGFGRSGQAGTGNGGVNGSGATDASRPGGAPSSAALGAAAGLVYASPQRLATAGERSFVPGRSAGDPGAGQQSERPSRQPGLAPPARVPYRNVLPAYREAAGRALARETIPLSRRDYVRAYFAQLED